VNVRVRVVRLRADPDLHMLSEDERLRAERIAGDAARRRFAGVRVTLREWRDELAAGGARDLRFSVSHSHELGAIAASEGLAVGIDVEHLRERPRLGAIASRVLGDEEAARISVAADPVRAFYDAWTRAEALGKALGTGLPLPYPAPAGYSIENLDLASGYAAAVAVEGQLVAEVVVCGA
jgi:4'-phosphopantetheinyl transferase superfamily